MSEKHLILAKFKLKHLRGIIQICISIYINKLCNTCSNSYNTVLKWDRTHYQYNEEPRVFPVENNGVRPTQLLSLTVSVVIAAEQGMCKSLSACCAVVGHMLAPANSCCCEQEEYINKSFHSEWVHDVTTATLCIAQVQLQLQDAAAWGHRMPRLKSAILLLSLCSGCESGVTPFSLHTGDFVLHCRGVNLAPPVCCAGVNGPGSAGKHPLPRTGVTTSIRNEPKPFVILVSDQGPGPRVRGQSSSACGLPCLTSSWALAPMLKDKQILF